MFLKFRWSQIYCVPHQLKVWWGHCPTCHTYSALHVMLSKKVKYSYTLRNVQLSVVLKLLSSV